MKNTMRKICKIDNNDPDGRRLTILWDKANKHLYCREGDKTEILDEAADTLQGARELAYACWGGDCWNMDCFY